MHIYFSGIGGVGIGPLALIAKDAGYSVSGSDMQKSKMTDIAVKRGIPLHIGQDDNKFISQLHKKQPIDWLVHTSAIKGGHPEFDFAMHHSIRISKRDELLNKIISDKKLKLIAVAGTHGKTTTTAMIVWLFKQLNIPVSYSVGTHLSFGDSAVFDSKSEYFIYEADEFDKNFLHFKPHTSVITNIDFDHADTYKTQKDYSKAFESFIKDSNFTISWEDELGKHNILVDKNDGKLCDSTNEALNKINLNGEHNRKNATLAIEAFKRVSGKDDSKLIEIINKFPGSERRFEKLADNLYTDYAHHPTEIKAMVQLAKEINENVCIVYQPHQNVRQHEIMSSTTYSDCFKSVNSIYWLPTYLSREDEKLSILTPAELTRNIKDVDIKAVEISENLKIEISNKISSGNLVLCLSAGDLDDWLREQFLVE